MRDLESGSHGRPSLPWLRRIPARGPAHDHVQLQQALPAGGRGEGVEQLGRAQAQLLGGRRVVARTRCSAGGRTSSRREAPAAAGTCSSTMRCHDAMARAARSSSSRPSCVAMPGSRSARRWTGRLARCAHRSPRAAALVGRCPAPPATASRRRPGRGRGHRVWSWSRWPGAGCRCGARGGRAARGRAR